MTTAALLLLAVAVLLRLRLVKGLMALGCLCLARVLREAGRRFLAAARRQQ